MNIKNLIILKHPSMKARLCALSLAGMMTITMIGCSNSKSNRDPEEQGPAAITLENREGVHYLDGKASYVMHRVESLADNQKKRNLILR